MIMCKVLEMMVVSHGTAMIVAIVVKAIKNSQFQTPTEIKDIKESICDEIKEKLPVLVKDALIETSKCTR